LITSNWSTSEMMPKTVCLISVLFIICEALPGQHQTEYYRPANPAYGDVVDVLLYAGEFKTLAKIATDLDLVDTLKNAEALTVFAPNDKAFSKLPAGTLESLTPEQAKEIVLRHVVTAKVRAEDVATGPVETIGGEIINLIKSGGVKIQGPTTIVNVDVPNIYASNGVIHRIDAVIL